MSHLVPLEMQQIFSVEETFVSGNGRPIPNLSSLSGCNTVEIDQSLSVFGKHAAEGQGCFRGAIGARRSPFRSEGNGDVQ